MRSCPGQKSWLQATDGDPSSLRQKRHALEGFFLLLTVSLGGLENPAGQNH